MLLHQESGLLPQRAPVVLRQQESQWEHEVLPQREPEILPQHQRASTIFLSE